MKMFIADTERDFSVIHSIEVEQGAYLMPKKTRGSFSEQSDQLLKLVLKHHPEKLVFDEHGLGLGLKEKFAQLLSESQMELKDDGTLVYN